MSQTILVTGATGYIASRLIPRLLKMGYLVRCLARRPERLTGRTWYSMVEMACGDVTLPETLPAAMKGVSAAYYLVHSMSAGHGYDVVDLLSARNFARAATIAGVEQIIYLGGLANPEDSGLSKHMKSRIASGDALREAGVPVTELRAGVIVGPGSVSFEMIRFIAEQFPLMVGPFWLLHRSQPISASNVLDFLVAVLTTPAARGKVIELGSFETMSYVDVISGYARIRGLRRAWLLLPFIPVRLMAFFIDLLTPVETSYALPLLEGLQNDSLVLDRDPLTLFPEIDILDYPHSVQLALTETHPTRMERVWLDLDQDSVEIKHEGMFIHFRRLAVSASPSAFINALQHQVSTKTFRLGLLNSFCIDFLSADTLRLRCEQKLPGSVWLEWKVTPQAGGSLLEQTTFYAPKGLPGFLGWYLLNPFHRWMFARLIQHLASLK